MTKQRRNYRLSEEALEAAQTIAKIFGTSETDAIERALIHYVPWSKMIREKELKKQLEELEDR